MFIRDGAGDVQYLKGKEDMSHDLQMVLRDLLTDPHASAKVRETTGEFVSSRCCCSKVYMYPTIRFLHLAWAGRRQCSV